MSEGSNAKGRWTAIYLIIRESLSAFMRDNCLERGATLAYCGFLALIPMLLLAVFVVSHCLALSEGGMQALDEAVSRILPLSNKLVLKEVHAIAGKKAWGVLTLVVLLWSMTPLSSALRNAFQAIFRIERNRTFLRATLFDIVSATVTLMFFVALVAAKPVYGMALRQLPMELWFVRHLVDMAAPLLATVMFLVFFYRLFAPVRPQLKHCLYTAIVIALMLSVMEPVFGLVLKYNPSYGLMFGSMKAIFMFLVWVYYAFLVVLFGAELVAVSGRREALLLRGLFDDQRRGKGGRIYKALLNDLSRGYETGETIFEEGAQDLEMFFIIQGKVDLISKGEVYRTLGEGEYFGEMAMLLKTQRTMKAVAAAPETRLVTISDKNFDTVLRENPGIVRSILHEMADRLKTANERIGPAAG